MRGDMVNIGDLVEYRGAQVEVVNAWRSGYGVPAGGFEEPVGIELKLAAGLVVRLVWPLRDESEGAITDLEASLTAYPIEAL